MASCLLLYLLILAYFTLSSDAVFKMEMYFETNFPHFHGEKFSKNINKTYRNHKVKSKLFLIISLWIFKQKILRRISMDMTLLYILYINTLLKPRYSLPCHSRLASYRQLLYFKRNYGVNGNALAKYFGTVCSYMNTITILPTSTTCYVDNYKQRKLYLTLCSLVGQYDGKLRWSCI